MTEVLALIPARGGSKSIPRKNIINFAGYPLIAYSIAAGIAAETVTRVIVSTDDEEIAEVSRRYGAETPFVRPQAHAQDNTPDLPVFIHTLEWLAENENYHPDIVVQLRPTSPFRRVWHIDQSVLRLVERPDADAVRTVCIPFQNPFKMWRIGPDGLMQPIGSDLGVKHEPYNQPRQVLPEIYWQTGYVDAVWADTILTKNSMTGDHILPLTIDPGDWVDIDSPDDWRRAERLIESGEVTLEDLGFELRRK
ncbi:MAG: acylneuraminate cytidylyltransferase family protein [Anaerolineae bacterium]|nr:acylneuraminate cytidylyltransferase family protein [Anaerolineae bacterium]MBL6966511.1 acylneuraminate cytidylyltransferase family protein [Anaerolineales bacterium]